MSVLLLYAVGLISFVAGWAMHGALVAGRGPEGDDE